MLVITSKVGDVVTIGDHVKIIISRSKADGLKMAVDCPAHWQIQVVEPVEPEAVAPADRTAAIVTTRRRSR